jgi:hypothetical protein
MGYSHYYFDENYRCIQNKSIAEVSNFILFNEYGKIKSISGNMLSYVEDLKSKLEKLKEIITETRFTGTEKTILVQSQLIEEFSAIITDYFKSDIEEITVANINIPSNKIRYTSPIKYRGLENDSIYLITNEIKDSTKIQNYVGATRAMAELNIILWK